MTDVTPTPAKKCCMTRWLLPTSLLLNLFALGFIASPLMHGLHHGEHRAFSIDRLTQGLPDADAQKLRDAYAADEPSLDHNRETLKNSMRKISTILAEPQPDQAELQKTLDDIAAAQGSIREDMSDLIKHAATDLSPEARQTLSERGWQGYMRHTHE
jgi:Spy/CpxP family protein refolding chaperone